MLAALSLQDCSYIAELITAITTFLATGIGAFWVYHTWKHQERIRNENEDLRKLKEDPGIEVDFLCRQDTMPDGRVLLTIDYPVRNTGVLPIYPDMSKALYRVGRIPLASINGFVSRDVPVEDAIEMLCAPRRQGLRFEPTTVTVFTAQFLVEPGFLYAVEFILPSRIPTKDDETWEWVRWRAVFVPKTPTRPAG